MPADRTPHADSGAVDVTDLLVAMGRGEPSAIEHLMPLVHGELRRVARRQMRRERQGHTLQTTALVNEAFLRLVDVRRVEFKDRAHFFALSARVMRRILVDHARARKYQKRGGGIELLPLEAARAIGTERSPDLLALDDALQALARLDARKSQVVELRFFSGLSVTETAEVLSISPETVNRDWRLAKVWLLRELARGANGE
jgi:RNA polymerase sigma factor (TIGR02999 family)